MTPRLLVTFLLALIIATPAIAKTLDDGFLYSTVYIENKSTGGSGTGFIVVRRIAKDKVVWYLISNKHVLSPPPRAPGQTNNLLAMASISINTQSSNEISKVSRDIVLRDEQGNELVKGHATPQVDVAAVIITPYLHEIFAKPEQKLLGISEDRFADKDFLNKHFISIGDEALVIGYPLSLVEEGHVIPIARGVRIATKPDYDFRKQPIFLVDGTIIRGTSGSPVILPVRPHVWTEKNKVDTFQIQENHLVGIVSGTIKDWEIVIRKSITLEAAQEFSVMDNANLGIVFRVETIREVMDLFGMKKWQDETQQEN